MVFIYLYLVLAAIRLLTTPVASIVEMSIVLAAGFALVWIGVLLLSAYVLPRQKILYGTSPLASFRVSSVPGRFFIVRGKDDHFFKTFVKIDGGMQEQLLPTNTLIAEEDREDGILEMYEPQYAKKWMYWFGFKPAIPTNRTQIVRIPKDTFLDDLRSHVVPEVA